MQLVKLAAFNTAVKPQQWQKSFSDGRTLRASTPHSQQRYTSSLSIFSTAESTASSR